MGMDIRLQAMQAVQVLNGKVGTPTAKEYDAALNLNNQVLNATNDPVVKIAVALFVATAWQKAEEAGYTVAYDEKSDSFSVTGQEGVTNG